MWKLSAFAGAVIAVVAAMAAPAAAEHKFRCDSDVTGVTVRNVEVPRDATCSLSGVTVTGDVQVGRNAFFEAADSSIAGKVRADRSLTVFLDTGTTVGRSVKTHATTQVFVFNASVGGDLEVEDTSEVVQVCGTTIERGDLEIERSGTDLLVGDPQAVDCAGNTVSRGDVEIERNFTDVEFVVSGNTIAGDLEVNRNTGPVEKFVQDNVGGDELECERNEAPFTASNNTGWRDTEGQCADQAALTAATGEAPAH
jgi:hypothetical protein